MISVIVATYQRARYLPATIESVLAQSYKDYEIIVVDDGSTDNTKQVLSRYSNKIRYIYQENTGASSAKNRGVELSERPYISFIDSDDIWKPEKLNVQLEAIQAGSEIVFSFGQQFISEELSLEEKKNLYCHKEPMPAPLSGTLLVSKENFYRVGTFDTLLSVGIDVDWYARAKTSHLKVTILPDILMLRRIHPGNSGFQQNENKRQHLSVVKAHLDRLRNLKRR